MGSGGVSEATGIRDRRVPDRWIDPTPATGPVPLLYSIEEGGKRLGLGRTTMFQLIRDGKIQALHVGRRTLVAEQDLQDFVDSLRAERQAS